MKQKRLGKRITAGFLCLAMVLTTVNLPAFTTEVKATDAPTSQAPSVTAFANKFELVKASNFTLYKDATHTGVAQKVNFGNGKTWYIAGTQNDEKELVLLCDPTNPLGSSRFNNNSDNKKYDTSYGTYEGVTMPEDAEVYPNHYGASKIREYLIGLYENNEEIFSSAEQDLMKETKIYTKDTMAGRNSYSTSDKLYLAYGDYFGDTKFITVGSNSASDLNNGIKVGLISSNGSKDSPYIYTGYTNDLFSLRAAYESFFMTATRLVAAMGEYVTTSSVTNAYPVVPAFNMDLSSVLFASAATASSSDALLENEGELNAMTFRMDGTEKIKSSVATNAENIYVTKGSDESEYLYVQGNDGTKDWVYSKHITDNETVSAEDIKIAKSLQEVDLKKCKIWTEKTVDNVTYAKMATDKVIHEFINGICKDCGECQSVVEQGDHDFKKYVSLGDGKHKVVCNYCDAVQEGHDNDDCSGGVVTCVAKAVCEKCGDEYGDVSLGKHNFLDTDGNPSMTCTACKSATNDQMCGKSAYYVYDEENKTLYIYGSGSLDDYAFYPDEGSVDKPKNLDADRRNISKSVQKVIVGADITEIGKSCFSGSELNEIVFDNRSKLTTIGENAFEGSKLVGVELPDSVTTIEKNAFTSGYLEKATLSNNLTMIGEGAFNRTHLSEIMIPSSVETIGENAFRYCERLSKVTFSSGLKKIEDSAFSNCSLLSKIELPEGIESLGEMCFYYTGISEITIPSSVLTIGERALGYYTDSEILQYKQVTPFTIKGYTKKADCVAYKYYLDNKPETGWTYEETHTHDYTNQPYVDAKDGLNHHQICTICEEPGIKGNHDFSEAEYKNDGDGKHYQICALCTSESEHEACSGGTATCQKKAVCSHCKTEYGELAAHTWDAGEITKAATCKDKGVKTFKCTVTGCTATKTEDVAIDSTNHVNTEVLGKKSVTCTVDGYTGDTHCKDCDTTFHAGSVITATGHTWDAGTVTTPATCKTKGVKTFKCTVEGCTGTKTEDIAIDASNHVNTEVVGKKDATCTEKGYTGDTHCKDCDSTVTGTEIQATGHDMTKVVSAEVPATCEADGKEAVMGCKNCDHEEGGAVIPAKGHTWDAGTVTTLATCKTKGVKTFKCTVEGCTGTKTEDIAVDANNHINTEVINAKEATCTEKGYTGDTHCKDCDTTVTGTEIAATGHDMTKVVSTKVAATCEKDGKEAVMGCKNCDHTEGGAVIKATGHKWDNGTVTKQPTVTSEGVKNFKCTNTGCNETKTELIAKLPKPKKNEVIEDKTGNDYKVTDPNKKEVTYKAPANKKAKTVTIPASVKINGVTYKVTKVDDKAFKGNTTVTKVVIPSSVTVIGAEAFSGCKNLTTVSIPKNVTQIGKNAFKGCAKLTKVTLPEKASKIGASAFDGCKKMKTITIKSTKLTSKSVSANAFKGLSKNVTIKVPKKQLKAYKSLLKKKGFKGKVK